MKPSCGTCVFFDGARDNIPTYGRCHRMPPTTALARVGIEWPVVEATEWCGEFKIMPKRAKRNERKRG